MTKNIEIMVNGFRESIPVELNLSGLILHMDEDHPELIAELNGRFVHPRDYDKTSLKDGDRVELIHAAFGG